MARNLKLSLSPCQERQILSSKNRSSLILSLIPDQQKKDKKNLFHWASIWLKVMINTELKNARRITYAKKMEKAGMSANTLLSGNSLSDK